MKLSRGVSTTSFHVTIGYQYDHDADEGFSGADYWPEEMSPQTFYKPTGRGFEAKVAERLAYWEEMRRERRAEE